MDSIPFRFDNVHAGFSTCTGLLHLTETGLRCEYRYDIGGVGLKTGTRESEVAFDEIQSIEFKSGWFSANAVLRPQSLRVLERFPVPTDEAVVFRFRRKDRSRAELLFSEADLRVSQSRLDAIRADR